MEVQAINVEKKQLMNHWTNSLAGVKQRDEAYVAAQELLRYGIWEMPQERPQIIWRAEILKGAVCLLLLHGYVRAGYVRQSKSAALKYIIARLLAKKYISLLLCFDPQHHSLSKCGVLFSFKLSSISFIWISFLLKVPLLLQHPSV